MKLSSKRNLKTRRKKSKKKRYIKTRKCRNIVRRNRRHTGGNQTSIDINKKSTGLIQGTEKTQIINTSTQNKVPVDYPSVYQILNFKSCTQDKVQNPNSTVVKSTTQIPHTKIIHLNLDKLYRNMDNLNNIDFVPVKIKYPGIEYVEVTVDKSFEFKILNDIIKKGQRTLIYSFSSEPNDEFIKKYNVYLGDPSHYNKNLSIIHTTVFKTLYIEHSVEYELVLNVYFLIVDRVNKLYSSEDKVIGKVEFFNEGIIGEEFLIKDKGITGKSKYNMNHLEENFKYRLMAILVVKDHHWWYNLFLTRPCTEAMMLQKSTGSTQDKVQNPNSTVVKSTTQIPHTKIIHLNLDKLYRNMDNLNNIDFVPVKIKYPGIEYVEVTVDKSFEFKILNDIIKKGQRTLIYSFSSEPNDEFIKKYNVYLGDPSHYNKNLSIIHTTVFKTLYIEHSSNYELVLNVYFLIIIRVYEDEVIRKAGFPNQGIIKQKILIKDKGITKKNKNKRGKYKMNHLEGKLKYRLMAILEVNDHRWWYNLFLTRPCTEAMMLQYGGTCAIVSILNLIFMTPYIASAASAYLQSFYKGIESEIVPFDKMRDPNKNCETLCRSFIYNILVKKQKLKPSDGNITILLSMRLKGITEKDPPDENHYKKCENYSLEEECQNLKKKDECQNFENLSEEDTEHCLNSKMGYTYGEGVDPVKISRCLLSYILDRNDYWLNSKKGLHSEKNEYNGQKIRIFDEDYEGIDALRKNPKLDGFVLTSCSILITLPEIKDSSGNLVEEVNYHASFGFICNDIHYIVDNSDVFEFDWGATVIQWDNYAKHKETANKFEIQIYVYQKLE